MKTVWPWETFTPFIKYDWSFVVQNRRRKFSPIFENGRHCCWVGQVLWFRIASETSQTMREPTILSEGPLFHQPALSSCPEKCAGSSKISSAGCLLWKTGSWIRNQERSHIMHCRTRCFGSSIIFESQAMNLLIAQTEQLDLPPLNSSENDYSSWFPKMNWSNASKLNLFHIMICNAHSSIDLDRFLDFDFAIDWFFVVMSLEGSFWVKRGG